MKPAWQEEYRKRKAWTSIDAEKEQPIVEWQAYKQAIDWAKNGVPVASTEEEELHEWGEIPLTPAGERYWRVGARVLLHISQAAAREREALAKAIHGKVFVAKRGHLGLEEITLLTQPAKGI